MNVLRTKLPLGQGVIKITNMKTNVYGEFYDAVILQIVKPVTVDVSSADYTAEKLNKNTTAVDANGEQKPFIVCHNEAVTLKVETWKGDTVTWNFTAGPYPMPLRKIFTDRANVVTAGSTPITTIQIGY
jgi:hypothetical protein